ncbi:hypothetical protein BpHYR1_031433 [Brachionus plicatilis]|uniref:Uncharacterized protein n=1 Tax=Brachionus plicatilis TaxID=10195 RepID=A0A3M7RBJ4_BRAPC|nr:hypothetical protein BpHYR1_031433 [Brachionus plicatilis]
MSIKRYTKKNIVCLTDKNPKKNGVNSLTRNTRIKDNTRMTSNSLFFYAFSKKPKNMAIY